VNSELARRFSDEGPKILVLGEQAVALRIGKSLRHEGFDPVFPEELRLIEPPPVGEAALEALTMFLEEVSQKLGGEKFWIHPGVSRWADSLDLPQIGQSLGLTVIGPSAKTMGFFANRVNLLTQAEKLAIPHLVLNFEPIHTQREIEELILSLQSKGRAQGTPIVLKSARSDASSLSVRVIYGQEDFGPLLDLWLEQLRKNHGEVILFAERYIEGARRVALPFARSNEGKIWFFPTVDSSLQYRYRKVIEFSPAACIDNPMEVQLQEWSKRLAESASFVGVGTFEFIIDGPHAFLVEGTGRLGSAFHLWEEVGGASAVAWQLFSLKLGVRRSVPSLSKKGHDRKGLSVRIYAEDPLLQLPQPGFIFETAQKTIWREENFKANLDLGVFEKVEISENSDGLLGILTVIGSDSSGLLEGTQQCLKEIWVAGEIQTNERFVSEILEHPWVKVGMFHCAFLDEEFIPTVSPPKGWGATFASVCQWLEEQKEEQGEQKPRWVVGDQWARPDGGKLIWKDEPLCFTENSEMGVSGALLVENKVQRILAYPFEKGRWQVRIGNWMMIVKRLNVRAAAPKKPLLLTAQTGGKVHSLLYRSGVEVDAHEPLLILESLQTLVPHAVPIQARVIRWKVRPEERVRLGQELAEIERVVSPGA
jgi:acetyl/propionyl-CoA carboxylase alpha subunit